MHLNLLTSLATLAAVLGTPLHVASDDDDGAAAAQLASIAQTAFNSTIEHVKGTIGNHGAAACDLSKLRVRREWNNLPRTEKRAYIKAVQCLQSKPAKTPASAAPGAKTRFDDFVATHINQTLTIHYTGNFLSWHRYYTWYYWDWGLTALTGLENSAIFDGSDTSLSGNGAYQGQRPDYVLGGSTGLPPLYLPAGTGGGCATSGPFKDMKVNLAPSLWTCLAVLSRVGAPALTSRTTPAASVVISTTIDDFQMEMKGIPGSGVLGVHGAGHHGFGGNSGNDLFSLHPAAAKTIAGTNTLLNNPVSQNTTLDDYIDFGYAAEPPRRIRDLLGTVEGPFCYTYADS
ncbi:Di-copper centre-containing protein [Coniochaeta hoffmannii]|uniref:Di-copper centre-containing protein n=1 Tax=Coniochaeta hoffmannii TaxID=91930 RepID=A0AA38R0Z2_9PEZI|nr:Di-copper centre-containing protein [Coniochaeta hoffmannii]